MRDNVTVIKARALYSYLAENEDELSLAANDIIVVLSQELEDQGWWKGQLNGKIGVFPDNFVELIPAEEVCHPKYESRLLGNCKSVMLLF